MPRRSKVSQEAGIASFGAVGGMLRPSYCVGSTNKVLKPQRSNVDRPADLRGNKVQCGRLRISVERRCVLRCHNSSRELKTI